MPSADPASTAAHRLASLRALLTHFSDSLSKSTSKNPASPPSNALGPGNPNPLHVLRDATQLLKAQTTKLSLLLITAPFTPGAVASVLRACEGEAVPGALGAWALLCAGREVWGSVLVEEVRAAVVAAVTAFAGLLERCDAVLGAGRVAVGEGKEDVLRITGRVWEACDALVGVVGAGVVGAVVKKAEEWRALVRDAVEELKGWGEEEDDDDEEEAEASDEGSVCDMFGPDRIPRGREELRALLNESQTKLRLVSTLYQAVIKRRLKTIPFEPPPFKDKEREDAAIGLANTVDETSEMLKAIPEKVDEMACAFYELQEDGARALLRDVCGEAEAVAARLSRNWANGEDEFTAWVGKWRDAMALNFKSVKSANGAGR